MKNKENEDGGKGERKRLERSCNLRSGGGEWSDEHSTGDVRVSGSSVVATATDMKVQCTAEGSAPRDR